MKSTQLPLFQQKEGQSKEQTGCTQLAYSMEAVLPPPLTALCKSSQTVSAFRVSFIHTACLYLAGLTCSGAAQMLSIMRPRRLSAGAALHIIVMSRSSLCCCCHPHSLCVFQTLARKQRCACVIIISFTTGSLVIRYSMWCWEETLISLQEE